MPGIRSEYAFTDPPLMPMLLQVPPAEPIPAPFVELAVTELLLMVILLPAPLLPPPIPAPSVELAVTELLLMVISLPACPLLPPIPAPYLELAITEQLSIIILLQEP